MELHDQTAAAHELVAVIVLEGLRRPTIHSSRALRNAPGRRRLPTTSVCAVIIAVSDDQIEQIAIRHELGLSDRCDQRASAPREDEVTRLLEARSDAVSDIVRQQDALGKVR